MLAKHNPYQISAFTHAAREGSFSRAAEQLGVTQSSITQHVAKLEKAMGTQLFIRRRDGLQMTRAGTELFRISDRLATLEQLVTEKVNDYSALTKGNIRIIANAPRPAMPIVARFGELFPKVRIDFTLYDWTTAMALLTDRQVDIAVVAEPRDSDAMFSRELRRTCYKIHMRKDHPLADRQTLSLRDLETETIILPEDGSFTQQVVSAKCAEHGVDFSRTIRTTTFPVVKEAVLHGMGVGFLLEGCLYPSSNIVARPIREMPEYYRDCITTPTDKRELRLIKRFFDVATDVRVAESSPANHIRP